MTTVKMSLVAIALAVMLAGCAGADYDAGPPDMTAEPQSNAAPASE